MEKTYNPNSFENKIYQNWESKGYFNPDNSQAATDNPNKDKPFLITMPPPNVTGVLHQGHALFASIEDAYARWKRMLGFKVLWLPGTDHAGIATQLMVERLLESEGTSRVKVGREEFLKRTWQWKEEHGGIIQKQLRALGSSCDWSRERFTMDDESNIAVKESFLRFYHKGLIYRGERLVNWSTGLDTAVSDLEVVKKTVNSNLYHIRYDLEDYSGSLTVATTRPETLFADTAVAINPKDDRYKDYEGKKIKLPLTDRTIPIIADEYVDTEFGTGALKVTPGHDHNDWKIGQRHNLESLSTIDRNGLMMKPAGEFKGMKVKDARKATIAKLEEQGLLLKKEPHTHEVGHCDRSGVAIEPLISTQWFMKMDSMAKNALAAAKTSNQEKRALRYFPEFWDKTYFEWLENIQDWCISRQLWWGHQIPAWHCSDCLQITVPKTMSDGEPTKCIHCGSEKITQETDVLDTWYSSGLWPITTLGWPNDSADLNFYYPKTKYSDEREPKELYSLMETGSDIIFFWVSRMLMMCTELMDGRIPFEDVYLHAMVRDEKGQKMSKTKGNVVDPMDIINEHGADALRLTLLVLSGGGRNVNFNIKRLEGYKAFLNKLWNAVRFTMPNLSDSEVNGESGGGKSIPYKLPSEAELRESNFVNRWILSRLNETIQEVNKYFQDYRFDMAFNTTYQFVWYEFCDWYLECFKSSDKSKTDKQTLAFCINQILHLLHPIAPFITEEIYRALPGNADKALMMQPYPEEYDSSTLGNVDDMKTFSNLKELVEGLRNFRTENTISPKKEIFACLLKRDEATWPMIAKFVEPLARLKLSLNESDLEGKSTGKVSTANFDIAIPLDGLVDFEAESKRLNTQINKISKELEGLNKRLSNRSFLERANPAVVEKTEKEQSKLSTKLKSLEESLAALKA